MPLLTLLVLNGIKIMNKSLDKNSPIREKIAKAEESAREHFAELERRRKEKEEKGQTVGKIV
jgi:hypothetical protein